MADQFDHPLIRLVRDALATEQGQSVARDFISARDMAGDATEYVMDGPSRAIANFQNPRDLEDVSGLDAAQAAGDLALLLGSGIGLVGLGKGAASYLKNKAGAQFGSWTHSPPAHQFPIGPKIPRDSDLYTGKHTEAAQEVLRKQMADPSQHLSHKSLKDGFQRTVEKKGINQGPQGQELDDLVTGTLQVLGGAKVDLKDPQSIERAIQIATGNKVKTPSGWKRTTLAVPGIAAGAAVAEDQSLDQDPALLEVLRQYGLIQ